MGSGTNLVFIVSNMTVQLAAGLLLAAYLEPQGFGAFAVGMLALESALVFVHLPGVAFVREYSTAEREEALSTVAAIKLWLALPAAGAMALLAYPLADLFHVPAGMIQILAMIPVMTVFSSVAVMVFESRRRMVRRNIPVIAESAGRLAAILAVLATGFVLGSPEETAALVWLLGTLPSVAIAVALAPFPRLRGASRAKAREYFSFGWKTTLAQFIQKQLMWIGTLAILLFYVGTSAELAQELSGLFKVAFSLMFYIVTFGTAVIVMVYPMMSRAFAIEDGQARRLEAHRLLSLAFYYELIIALPLALALLLGAPAAFELLLPGFATAAPYAQALAPAGVVLALTLPAAAMLPAANRPDLILRLFLLQLAVAVGLNAALVPQAGAPWGGAWGAVIADWGAAIAGFAYVHLLARGIGIPFPSFAVFREALRKRAPDAPPAP
ncbi:MAG TPA: polysaccharide biosynthesis C-terminal domain-containing protein [Candidatus Thermoplasmatota archaeon]